MWKRALQRAGFYLAMSGVFMFVMLVVFTVFYHTVESDPTDRDKSLSWLDSFYFTVITTRTIGFGDIHPKSTLGKLGTICNALLPATVFMGASLLVLQALFESLEQYWKEWLMKRYTGHTIAIADLALLPSIIREYEVHKVPLLVVNETRFHELPDNVVELVSDSTYLRGDPTRDQTLVRARIAKAHSILIATSDDALNLYVLVTAKGLNPDIHATVRVNSPEAVAKMQTAGAEHLLPAATILGRMLSHAAVTPISSRLLVDLNTSTHDPFLCEHYPKSHQCERPVRDAFPGAVAVFRNEKFLFELTDIIVKKDDVVLCISTRFEPT